MTNKELLYVEDALGHEQFMQKCSKNASSQLQDQNLAIANAFEICSFYSQTQIGK